ncbi:helix-turn-helix domain-containing protein [Curtobacterium flaccumfaciens]|nr:helix-turn-helix domain-containing protein [Curtobacterium flaccumfaciens]
MLGILGGDERCPIARSLDVLGEKWTLMIVRDALRRLDPLQPVPAEPRHPARGPDRTPGLARRRGVLERTTYKPEGARAREEYVLTGAGRDLSLVLLALGGWADRHRPSERPSDLRFVDADSGEAVEAAAVTVDAQQRIPTARLRAVMEPAS